MIAESGYYSADDLIAEIETYNVEMVLLDIAPETAHHMVSLDGYDRLLDYLKQTCEAAAPLQRGRQLIQVFRCGHLAAGQ
ncbi:MAG: hypothetical protein GX600_09875 [Dehalococcoidia bacterium]|nr:hypothetical protein [Dehalococcoidia bacterium]